MISFYKQLLLRIFKYFSKYIFTQSGMIILFNLSIQVREAYTLNFRERRRLPNSLLRCTNSSWQSMTPYRTKNLNYLTCTSMHQINQGEQFPKCPLLFKVLRWSLWNESLWREFFIPLNTAWISSNQYVIC